MKIRCLDCGQKADFVSKDVFKCPQCGKYISALLYRSMHSYVREPLLFEAKNNNTATRKGNK